MTDDEKTQRLLAEQRHNQIVDLLQAIKDLLTKLVKEIVPAVDEEKKEGE